MEMMETMTQAKKMDASLFTYFTPTKTSNDIRRRQMLPYTLMLFNMAAPPCVKMAASGTMYSWKRKRKRKKQLLLLLI